MNLDGLELWGGLGSLDWPQPDVVIAGIPYDGSAVYRAGAALAPARIRALSPVMPPITESGRSLLGLRIVDIGDLNPGGDIESGWEPVAERLRATPAGSILSVIGGDHCITIPVLAAQAARHPGLAVLWVDAHPDLCESSRGGRWTCGCALRRALEVSGVPPSATIIAGGRDFDAEELEFMQLHDVQLLAIGEVARDPGRAGQAIAAAVGDRPLHVSFDIDVLDPAFAPGTEIPSGGGLSTRQALDLLAAIGERARLVGLDVTEVCPPGDHNDITSLAALKVMFEFWGIAWKPPT